MLLWAMSLFVLLLACANVANLQLGRALRRRREVSVRLALGVSRGRLVRQLATESLLLAGLGALAAIVVARLGAGLMQTTLLTGLSGSGGVGFKAVLYGIVVAALAALMTGLLPAWQSSRPDVISALRSGSQPTGTRSRVRDGLLVTQSALALVLLIGTGLFTRSLGRIQSLPLGLDANGVFVLQLNTTGRVMNDTVVSALYRSLETTAMSLPGIESASLTMALPFGATTSLSVYAPGRDSLPVTADGGPYVNAVGPGYFAALRTPMKSGRAFTDDDREGSAPVVIVNETTARLWWPGESALGKCVHLLERTTPCRTVVGVVANTRRRAILEEESVQLFAPHAQSRVWAKTWTLIARARASSSAGPMEVRNALQAAIPGLPYLTSAPLAERIDRQTQSWRLGAAMFGAFGLLAIVLAAIGLYGVLAYDVSRRTKEIGVRLALGGRPRGVSRSILWQGMQTSGAGAALGLVLAAAGGVLVEPLLFQTSRLDPVVYSLALGVVVVTTAAASWIPAMRAGRVDAVIALQSE